jgi:hypothetical protein
MGRIDNIKRRNQEVYSPSEEIFFYYGSTAPSGPRPPRYRGFMITFRHTRDGRTPPGE